MPEERIELSSPAYEADVLPLNYTHRDRLELHFTRLSVHGAGARAARITARPAGSRGWSSRGRCITCDGKLRDLLREAFAFALGATGFLLSEDDNLKFVFALLADVFENRHKVSSVKIGRDPLINRIHHALRYG